MLYEVDPNFEYVDETHVKCEHLNEQFSCSVIYCGAQSEILKMLYHSNESY